MPLCPHCQQPATHRDGHHPRGQQRYACRPCGRDFTETSATAFAGYRWPADVILMAVRWYLSLTVSATQVTWLLAERGVDVTPRTVLTWAQTFGPQLAAEVRRHRRRVGRRWYVDEVFLFRKKGEEKRYLYRAVDEHGQVVDVLLREQRDTESAKAFFRQARRRSGVTPTRVITDHHQPYIRAVQEEVPAAAHVRTGLHRARGETTKPIERSHIATRDRLRTSRGLKHVTTGQRFVEGFEALQALRRGYIALEHLVPGYRPGAASPYAATRAVVSALAVLAARLPSRPSRARPAPATA
jgi:transposase-like protein